MSDIKISELPEAESVNDEDLIMVVQEGANKKVPAKKVGTGKGGVSGDTLPIGAVIELPSDIVPENWLLCDGSAVSRTDYAELFAVLGTSHGEGDGSTTFNLPNMCGRTPVGKDSSDTDFDTLGKTLGEKEHTLTVDEMPSHSHILQNGDEAIVAEGETGIKAASISVPGEGYMLTKLANAGGNQAHNNIQPSIIVNFIIKAKQSAGLVATVVNSLESDSEVDGLSAKQGKVLNEKIEGTILYENEEGTSEAFTLNDSEKNYKYVEILFEETLGGTFSSVKCEVTSNTNIGLMVPRIGASFIYLFATSLVFSEGAVAFSTQNTHIYFKVTDGTIAQNEQSLDRKILVHKVIGYK